MTIVSYLIGSQPVLRSSRFYGEGNGSILLRNLNCNGTEKNLLGCPSLQARDRVCSHSEDAGVRCGSKLRQLFRGKFTSYGGLLGNTLTELKLEASIAIVLY